MYLDLIRLLFVFVGCSSMEAIHIVLIMLIKIPFLQLKKRTESSKTSIIYGEKEKAIDVCFSKWFIPSPEFVGQIYSLIFSQK